jgi:hypothetical protein
MEIWALFLEIHNFNMPVLHAITMQLLKKSNMVDYICMYDVYKLLYKRPIFNSLVTMIQQTDFFDMTIYY